MSLVDELSKISNTYSYKKPPGDIQDMSRVPNDEAYQQALNYVNNYGFALDVGGHIGSMTRRLAPKFDRVVVFEPAFHKYTKLNTKEFNNVTIEPHGLGNEEKTEQMWIMKKRTGGSSIVRHPRRWEKWQHKSDKQEISIKTLDSYQFTDIDFIKIDVESYEWFVIDGARETLTNNSPVIMIEYLEKYKHHKYPPNVTHNLLEQELKYERVMTVGDDHIYIPRS